MKICENAMKDAGGRSSNAESLPLDGGQCRLRHRATMIAQRS